MNTPANTTCDCAEISAAAASVNQPVRPSRLTAFFDFVIRHAGSVAVDHTHLLPIDRISGRTGIYPPPASRRGC